MGNAVSAVRVFVAAVCLSAGGAMAAPAYRLTDLGDLGSYNSSPLDPRINERSEVLFGNDTESFIYQGGITRRLDFLNGMKARPTAINDRGDLAGTIDESVYWGRPFLYADGRIHEIPLGGATYGHALALNNQRQVTGLRGQGLSGGRAFIYDTAGTRTIDMPSDVFQARGMDINESGTVAGWSVWEPTPPDTLRHFEGFVHDDSGTQFFGDRENNILVNAINDAGIAVGLYGARPVIFKDGVATVLPVRGESAAYDINNAGVVVGGSNPTVFSELRPPAFIYRDGKVRILEDMLSPADASRWDLASATSINEKGEIVGLGYQYPVGRPLSVHAFLLSPVPEPGTWAQMAVGLGLLLVLRRRGQRRRGAPNAVWGAVPRGAAATLRDRPARGACRTGSRERCSVGLGSAQAALRSSECGSRTNLRGAPWSKAS